MQYALPATPPGGLTAGLDWASADHVVCVTDATGAVVTRFTVEHTAAGLADLVRRLTKTGVGEVAIERGDGPVIDALLAAGVTVVVISPNQLKHLRSRYGSAGNKDDRFDAYVLADTLRTDRVRLRPLQPDSPATVTLRATVRARRDLVAHRVAVCNQLRAHLQHAFPAAVGFFAELDSPISLAFLARFDCQDRADWLSAKRLGAWLTSVGYCGRKDFTVLYGRLVGAPRGATGETGAALAHITRALLAVLRTLVEQIKVLSEQIAEQLALHADSPIFSSLPRSGTVRAARLLAEIGDCRARFPDPESLICLAEVAPSARQSGKHKAVTFRWAVNKQLRDAVCDFAADSRRANPWAAKLYKDAIARGKDHPHATRILARAWLYVIWHCWHDHVPSYPSKRRALQRLLNQDQPTAA
ncbi:IS110 family transposase [Saccharopolyspora sp. NPDC000995]